VRIIQVVSHVGNEASGPSYTVPRLSRALGASGNDVTLFSLRDGLLTPSRGFQHQVFAVDRTFAPLWGSRALREALLSTCGHSDILHSHGLWLLPNMYVDQVAKQTSIVHVISPRGTLAQRALARSRLRKSLALRLFQRSSLTSATCLHATADMEYADIRRAGLRQPVAIVPNGVDLAATIADEQRNLREVGRRVVLFLGRIHPQKGIDLLIRAWSRVPQRPPDCVLRIVGLDSDGYLPSLRRLAQQLGATDIEFAGPAYGGDKHREYRSATVYVLPTHSENFGITVAEALANGTPVIATKGAPWEGLHEERCGWWVDHGLEPLAAALQHALGLPALELHAMGTRGQAWMARDFNWDVIAERMTTLYHWLRHGGSVPTFVRLN
jgi:glycosyltransferase involved in cell wall biosynthesis